MPTSAEALVRSSQQVQLMQCLARTVILGMATLIQPGLVEGFQHPATLIPSQV